MATSQRAAAIRYLVLTMLSVPVLFPIWMTIVRAISTPASYVRAGQPPYPVDPQWDIWSRAWQLGDLGHKVTISLMVTILIVVAQLITSILSAYAFTFLDFPLKKMAFAAFLVTLMLPIEVTLLPNIETIRSLGWLNSYPGLVAPFLATAFGTFLIRQAFMGIPRDLKDAAELDGFGHMAFLRQIAIPLSRPVIASFTVISFLSAWNQYTWPRAVVTESRWETLQIGLKSLAAAKLEENNIGIAAALIAAVPILLLLIFLQRHLVRGLTAGAVKG